MIVDAIYFPEVNLEIAKGQEEFKTLPAFVDENGIVVTCHELTDDDLERLNKTKDLGFSVRFGLLWLWYLIK